jgi:hypothetical protein
MIHDKPEIFQAVRGLEHFGTIFIIADLPFVTA